MLKTKVTQSFSGENDVIFEKKCIGIYIEFLHFKTIFLNDDLFLEVCNDPAVKKTDLSKEKHIFI